MTTYGEISKLASHPPFTQNSVVAISKTTDNSISISSKDYLVSIPIRYRSNKPCIEDAHYELWRAMLYEFINDNIPDALLKELC